MFSLWRMVFLKNTVLSWNFSSVYLIEDYNLLSHAANLPAALLRNLSSSNWLANSQWLFSLLGGDFLIVKQSIYDEFLCFSSNFSVFSSTSYSSVVHSVTRAIFLSYRLWASACETLLQNCQSSSSLRVSHCNDCQTTVSGFIHSTSKLRLSHCNLLC